jgi:hypothetical protein
MVPVLLVLLRPDRPAPAAPEEPIGEDVPALHTLEPTSD